MRSGAVVLSVVLATMLVAGCQHPAEPPAKAAVATPAGASAHPVRPLAAVGAIFLGGTDTHTCTGAVVHSRTGDLVLTAAHCLAEGYPATFVPGFDGQAGPADTWNVDKVYLDPRWLASQDEMADYAFVKVSRHAGGTLETVSGAALALGTAPRDGTDVTVTGYPEGVGGPPIGCQTVTTTVAAGYPKLRCGGLVDGTSGAPWMNGSTAVGLIGGLDGGGCDDSVSYSPPFDDQIIALLARAEAGGPGDTPPNVLEGTC